MKRMAKKKPAPKQDDPAAPVKVWRIARFKERYEYRDDKDKKGVLQYTRDFVSAGADAESRHFIDQLAELKEHKNWRAHEGSFVELKRRSADDVYGFRGYLLHKHQPADTSRIARWLDCSEAECKETLDVLAEVGLIELVDVPDFTAKAKPGPAQDEQPAGPLAAGNSAETPENSRGRRKNPAKRKETKSENEKNLKEKRTGNPKPEEQSKISQSGGLPQREAGSKTESNEPETRNPKEKQTAGQQAASAGKGQSDAEPAEPVKNPTQSDAPGGESPATGDNPQDSAYRGLTEAMDRLYEPSCSSFAVEIFRNLFNRLPLPEGQGTREARTIELSELASFASAWARAQNAKLKPRMLLILWDRSVYEANKLGVNRRRKIKAHNLPAVWWSLFKKLLNTAREGELKLKHDRPPDG